MNIILIDENGEALVDASGTLIVFHNVIKPSALFDRYLKDEYPAAVSFKEHVVNFSAEDILEAVRTRRNRLLSLSDWTQLPDNALSVEDQQAWTEYRTALRDLTEDFAGTLVDWPRAPDGTM